MKKFFSFIIILSSFIFVLSDTYKELSKHSSVRVAPNTKVYFDISSFENGELISFEINMDLFFGSYNTRDSYTFYIEQVSANSYYDSKYWNNLRKVTNKNVSCSASSDCTFTWDEIKEEGKNYIYIIPPTPFNDFYTFWNEKIKITHLGGLSAGAIVGIVFGCLAFVGILIAIAACCCCRYNPNCYACCHDCCPCCACCCNCCRGSGYGIGATSVVSVSPPVIPAQIPAPVYSANVYPHPEYPTPGYQVNPYSSSAVIYN